MTQSQEHAAPQPRQPIQTRPRPENMSLRQVYQDDPQTDRIDTDEIRRMVEDPPTERFNVPVSARHETNSDRKKVSPLIKWGSIGLATAILGGGAAAYGLSGNDSENTSRATYDVADTNHDGVIDEVEKIYADGVVTKDEKDTISSFSNPGDASRIAPADLVTVYGGDFDSWRPQAYSYISTLLTDEQKKILNQGKLPTVPKSEWDQQSISNQITLDIADMTIQDDRHLGQVMLPTVLDTRTPGYNDVFSNAEGGTTKPNPTIAVYEVAPSSYPKPRGSFMGVEGLSEDSQLIGGTYVENGTGRDGASTKNIVMLVDLVKSPDGKSENWRKVGFWDSNDPRLKAAVADIQ